jgi:hypothetical protein
LARVLRLGEMVRADFDVGSDGRKFDLLCRVCSVTEGSNPETLVIGMSFVENELSSAVRLRLRDVLIADD